MGRKYRTVHQYGKRKRRNTHLNFRKKVTPAVATTDTVATAAPTVIVEASTAESRQHHNPDAVADSDRAQQQDDKEVASSASPRPSDSKCNASVSHAPESAAEYMIVDLEAINALLKSTVCRTCRGSLSIVKGEREYGLAVKLCLVCSNCGLTENSEWSSPRVAGTARIQPFEVNVLASRAAKKIGIGPTALNNMLSTMGLSHKGQRKTHQENVF